MISVQSGGNSEEIRTVARHKLFVEGGDGNVIDAVALEALLPEIDIEVMGPSFHLKSVAKALYPHHKDYYFLIDRDHHDDQTVENSWKNFPDPETSNLLIWKKREIENYFLDPDYLQKSQFLKPKYTGTPGRRRLEAKIIKIAQQRLFMDVTNRVILTIREEQKQTWIETFRNPGEFPSKKVAKEKLSSTTEFENRKIDIESQLNPEKIEALFEKYFTEFSGNNDPLIVGQGDWINLMSGKEILRQIINNCFKVIGSEDNTIQGTDKYNAVIRDLVRDISHQPTDFKELHKLITKRTKTR